jgi:hypothetical protein
MWRKNDDDDTRVPVYNELIKYGRGQLCSIPNNMYQTRVKRTSKNCWRGLQCCMSVPWGPPILPPFKYQE